ncbi:deoxyribonuclease IV [Candidatus Babeliales bacterium]|nr:deoxyribonuclease IV [Candidatus Babeliales bacterium]
MNYNRDIGLHLRLIKNLSSLNNEAIDYKIKSFQFFLTKYNDGKYLKITDLERKEFLKIKRKYFSNIYIHSSYWINLATGNKKSLQISISLLKKEIRIAKQLEIKYIVLHPGSATGYKNTTNNISYKQKGIQKFATIFNNILKKEKDIQILLENTSHGKNVIGSNLNDFSLLLELINHPEKINFCIDFAHAFAYGYDIEKTEDFTKLLDKHMKIDKIKLIHLSDSAEEKGSKIDKHEIPGKGCIGEKTLKNLILHKKLNHIPILLELPLIENKVVKKVIESIKKIITVRKQKTKITNKINPKDKYLYKML